MNKPITGAIVVVVIGLASLFLVMRGFQPVRNVGSPIQPRRLSPLTENEEGDLLRLTRLALKSVKDWDQPINCLEQAASVKVDIGSIIKDSEGRVAKMRLVVRENSLLVFLDELHTYLVFPRLHDRGLAPPEVRTFCEQTYESSVAAQAKYPYFERSKKELLGDPGITAIVDGINHKFSLNDYDIETHEEFRVYSVPILNGKSIPVASRDLEKEALYSRIVEAARLQARLFCSTQKPITIVVPDFDIGEPKLYVYLEGASIPIVLMSLSRDFKTGEHTAEPVKNLGLPDELSAFSERINKRHTRKEPVNCRDIYP